MDYYKFKKCIIMGSSGGMAKIIIKELASPFTKIVGVDLKNSNENLYKFIKLDITSSKQFNSNKIIEEFKTADCLFICLPEDVALQACDNFSQYLPANILVIDILSVKTKFITMFEKALRKNGTKGLEYLTLGLMFGHEIGFKNQHIIYHKIIAGPLTESFLKILDFKGARTTEMHYTIQDKNSSMIQSLTHAAIISCSLALYEMGYDPIALKCMWTPFHKNVLKLIARILKLPNKVYWDIQKNNPFAQDARRALQTSMWKLDEMIREGKQEIFIKAFANIEAMLSPDIKELSQESKNLFHNNKE